MFHWRRKQIEEEAEAKAWTLSDPGDELLSLLGVRGPGLLTVESAAEVPAVACAMRVIAEAIGQLPTIIYRRGPDGSKERATDHPAYDLLHDAPNEWTSAFEFKRDLQIDVLRHNQALAFVNRVNGRPREIIRLKPGTVAVELDDVTGEPRYRQGERILRREDVINVRGPFHKSAVVLAIEAIELAAIMQGHASRVFKSGGRPAGVITHKGRLSKETKSRLREAWDSTFGGANSGRTAVLEEGMTFTPLTFSSVDLQFRELWTFVLQEIARAFRVPPHLIFELDRATWGNAEEMGRLFLTYCLMPWVKAWEGALNRAVFSREERSTYFVEFLVDDLQRADLAARSTAYQQLIAARVLSPNEARAMENRPGYDGGDEFVNPNIATASAGGEDA